MEKINLCFFLRRYLFLDILKNAINNVIEESIDYSKFKLLFVDKS